VKTVANRGPGPTPLRVPPTCQGQVQVRCPCLCFSFCRCPPFLPFCLCLCLCACPLVPVQRAAEIAPRDDDEALVRQKISKRRAPHEVEVALPPCGAPVRMLVRRAAASRRRRRGACAPGCDARGCSRTKAPNPSPVRSIPAQRSMRASRAHLVWGISWHCQCAERERRATSGKGCRQR
jgi:hypothetical protein